MYNEESENLPYVSSTTAFGGPQKTTSPDEADLPTLERVLVMLDERINTLLTNDSLNLLDPIFTVEQQLSVNQKTVGYLREVQTTIKTAVEAVKEA